MLVYLSEQKYSFCTPIFYIFITPALQASLHGASRGIKISRGIFMLFLLFKKLKLLLTLPRSPSTLLNAFLQLADNFLLNYQRHFLRLQADVHRDLNPQF